MGQQSTKMVVKSAKRRHRITSAAAVVGQRRRTAPGVPAGVQFDTFAIKLPAGLIAGETRWT
jgi:hypothetical protein